MKNYSQQLLQKRLDRQTEPNAMATELQLKALNVQWDVSYQNINSTYSLLFFGKN